MPLTADQQAAITKLLEGDPGENVNIYLSDLVTTRDELMALLSLHADITDINATEILRKIKTKAKTAAQAIVTLLT